ncbi:IS3 family transposase, partial [Lactococcus taiwanensis]
LKQEFNPKAPNQVWTTDFTYISIGSKRHVYLCAILDLYSRKCIAWKVSDKIDAQLACDTLKIALHKRKPKTPIIFHSDQGSQYTSQEYNQLLERYKIKHSYSRKGYPYHNASLESWHSHLKREWLYRHSIKDFNQAKHEIFWYIESFYNQNRIHQGLNYLTPNEFENKQQKLAA